MKTCPKCKSVVDDNFDICWNCQYSFSEDRIVQSTEFTEVCPQCNTKVDSSDEFCPNCRFDLRIKSSTSDKQEGDRKISCLRCAIPMLFKGNTDFHGGPLFGIHGMLNDLLTSRETFDLYFCPKCGKIEIFIPHDNIKDGD